MQLRANAKSKFQSQMRSGGDEWRRLAKRTRHCVNAEHDG
jgi:hypothetical protein